MGKEVHYNADDSDLEEGEIREYHSEYSHNTEESNTVQIERKIHYRNIIGSGGALFERNAKSKTDFINFTIQSTVLSPKKNVFNRKISADTLCIDFNAENIKLSPKSGKRNNENETIFTNSIPSIFQNITKKLSFDPVNTAAATFKCKSEEITNNHLMSDSSRIKSKTLHKEIKQYRSPKSGTPTFQSKIRGQTKMNSSVIEINDSIITIDSDGEVEDGEVQEVDLQISNLTAKTDPATPPSNINKQLDADADAAEKLIFEVKFRSKNDFNSHYDRLLTALNSTFSKDEFEIRTDNAELIICAYTRPPAAEREDDVDVSQLFLIDTVPTSKLNVAHIPSYKRCNTDVLDEETSNRKRLKAEAVNKCSRPKVQASCFNCGESDHSLRECTRPRNQARIQRARKKTNFRAERYHVDTEQRFAHIRPGKISTKTRHAMGYSRGEMPFMFYRMRVLGYPPAWLEEAKVQGSGMALFNADGTEVQGTHEEEGESDSFKYDINKIYDFPGFNAHPGAKFYDDYQHHSVPPFQEAQLKENFIKSLGENIIKGYKRKKLIDLPAPHDIEPTVENGTNCVEHDMELDDGEVDKCLQPPLPFESSIAAPPPPPPPASMDTPKRSPSPTLEDLRQQQAQLLQQLESNTSLSTSDIPVELDDSQSTTATVATPDKAVQQLFNGPSIQGTPIIKFSEFEKLPVGDNFKVGVSDVINFENLPDSTGKYEQMKDLLKSVRVKMEKLQNADD